MFCAKCGAKNPTGMNFCEKCGASLQEQVSQMVQENTGRKKNLVITAVCIGVVLLCVIGLLVYVNNQKQAQYNEKVKEAERYYQELDFERAETAYLEAIDIRPKETEAYLDLSEIYIQQGRQEEAIDLLEKGQKKTRDEEIETRLELVKADFDKKKSGDPQYKAYYDLCMDYLERYGEGEYRSFGFSDIEWDTQGEVIGLSVVRLIDFNEDGNMELLLAYSEKGEQEAASYNFYEVWAWQDNKLINVLPATKGNHGTDVSNWMAGVLVDGTIQLEKSWFAGEQWEYDFLKYDGEKFKASYKSRQRSFDNPSMEESFSIYGESVTREEFQEAVARAKSESEEEDFYSSDIPYSNSKGEFRIDFWSMSKGYVDSLLAETERTIESIEEKAEGANKNGVESYENIIEQYKSVVADRDNINWDDIESYGEYVSQVAIAAVDSGMDYQIYYAFKDIDGNGTDELLIASGADKKTLNNHDIFTLKEGDAQRFLPNHAYGDRSAFHIYKDGVIGVRLSGSAWDIVYEYYILAKDGYSLGLIESVSAVSEFVDYSDEREVTHYHENGGKQEISKKEFNDIVEKYEEKKKMSFDWKIIQ